MNDKNCKNTIHRFSGEKVEKYGWIMRVKDHLDGYDGNGETWLRLIDQSKSVGVGDPICSIVTHDNCEEDEMHCSMFLWRNGAEELCSQLAKLLGWGIHKPRSDEYSDKMQGLARAVLQNPGDKDAVDAYLEHLTSDWFEGET